MPAQKIDPRVQGYLTTLRRVPDDVMLAVGARDVEPNACDRCLCGWAVRENLVAMTGTENVDAIDETQYMAHEQFGGTLNEWEMIYYGVQTGRDTSPLIEEAFTLRVMEAAFPRRRSRKA